MNISYQICGASEETLTLDLFLGKEAHFEADINAPNRTFHISIYLIFI